MWTALVVEDDFILSFDLQSRLCDIGGGDVRIAASIEEAAALLSSWRPDVAFLDWRLGRGTSEAFARSLKEAGIRVAMISGASRTELASIAQWVDTILQKPVSDAALAEAVQSVLGMLRPA